MNIKLITERLRWFYQQHQRLPTHGEMCKLLRYKSKGATQYVVKKLIEAEILTKDEAGKLIPKNLFSIPMLGIVKAGYPAMADTQYDKHLNLHEIFNNISASSFALTVSGDSMINEGIHDGDLVIVNKDLKPKNGDIVTACVDNEWTVKYFYKDSQGNVSLVPANKTYPTIYPTTGLIVAGVVVSTFRKYY